VVSSKGELHTSWGGMADGETGLGALSDWGLNEGCNTAQSKWATAQALKGTAGLEEKKGHLRTLWEKSHGLKRVGRGRPVVPKKRGGTGDLGKNSLERTGGTLDEHSLGKKVIEALFSVWGMAGNPARKTAQKGRRKVKTSC